MQQIFPNLEMGVQPSLPFQFLPHPPLTITAKILLSLLHLIAQALFSAHWSPLPSSPHRALDMMPKSPVFVFDSQKN